MTDIAGLIKKAAVEAVDADKPVAVMFGVVAEVNPLIIDIEQKLKLRSGQLIITDGGAKKFDVGDKTALLRVQGGQMFIVLGRI